jgi:hypothetical protein
LVTRSGTSKNSIAKTKRAQHFGPPASTMGDGAV